MRSSRLLLAVLLSAAVLPLAGCSLARPLVATGPEAPGTIVAKKPAPAAELKCPACKVIIDYSALVSASADMEKAAYGAWETVLKGYEEGRFTWDEVKADVDRACYWAEKIRAWTVEMEKGLRELSLQPVP